MPHSNQLLKSEFPTFHHFHIPLHTTKNISEFPTRTNQIVPTKSDLAFTLQIFQYF